MSSKVQKGLVTTLKSKITPSGNSTVGGFHVNDILEWMVGNGKLKDKQAKAYDNGMDEDELLGKSILFNASNRTYFVKHHPNFDTGGEKAKYEHAMKFVAMTIESEEWKQIMKMEPADATRVRPRQLFTFVDQRTLAKVLALEIEFGIRDASDKTSKHKSTIHSLGTRYIALERAWKTNYKKSEVDIVNLIEERVNGGTGHKRTMTQFFASANGE